MHHYCIPLLLPLLAVISYQPLGTDGAVTYNYTQDKEVKELTEKAANDLAALVLKILEKTGKLVRQTGCTPGLGPQSTFVDVSCSTCVPQGHGVSGTSHLSSASTMQGVGCGCSLMTMGKWK